MPLSPEAMALAVKAGLLPPQGQGVVDADTTTIVSPANPPSPAAPPPPSAPPVDDRSYLERGWDALKGANNAAGNAILHPADTASALWDANKRGGQAILDANSRAGQAVLDAGRPSMAAPPEAPAQPQVPPPAPQPQAPQSLIQPMRVLPAREVRAVSPTVERMYGQAAGEERNAADLGQMADVTANDIGAKGIQDISETYGAQAAAMQKREAERRKQYDATQADYDRINKDAMNTHALTGDEARKNVGILGHIAMALGAGGAALTHTPNFALESINKRIEDNIAAQRTDIENKNRGAERSRLGLGEMRERFGDERQADAGEFARQLEEHKAAGDALVARANSPVLAAKWDMVKAGMSKQQAALHNQMFPWMPAQMVGGAAKPLDNVFMNIDGTRYQARDPDSRKKLTKSAQAVQDAESQIEDYTQALSQVTAMDRLAAKAGIKTENMSRADSAYTRYQTTLRSAADEGTWKKSEEGQFEKQLVDPRSFTGDPIVQMALQKKGIRDMHAHAMQTEDPLPVQQQFVQHPLTGQLSPRNPYTGGTVKPQAPPASQFISPIGAK